MADNSHFRRTSGVLIPVASLPGPFGIGDLGPTAFHWVDTLNAANQDWWQLLPVGPTGFGDSPYQSPSTFAGNTNLISPEVLRSDNLLSSAELATVELPEGPIDYTAASQSKQRMISTAFQRFQSGEAADLRIAFRHFCEREAKWLEDFALFSAIKENFEGLPWWQWARALSQRDPKAINAITSDLADDVQAQRFAQFLFFRQWEQLKSYAATRGVSLFGDLPIYVADDSADVWCHPELFLLDENRRPLFVAGVPPDYFSQTGQLWGNPLYRWDYHRETGFTWWIERMRAALRLFDRVRIDHFRGIEAFWAVPAGDGTAHGGHWSTGPGEQLLAALRKAFGALPLVAEDLGFITPGVDRLREEFELPGMRILQFAFGGAVEERFLPHRFTRDLLVTTGTHDNDTTLGWYESLTEAERGAYESYVPDARREPVWSLIRTAWSSVAEQAIVPLQDLLGLGSSARMNSPGSDSGNWRWRATAEHISNPPWIERLASYTRIYERSKQAAE